MHRIQAAIEKVFRAQLAAARVSVLHKAADDDEVQAFVDAIIAAIENEWLNLPLEVQPGLESAMRSGIGHGFLQIEFSHEGLIAAANTVAEDYARDRAAELIGMTRDVEGNLIPNPDARWVISNTSREKIREIVSEAFTQETPLPEIKAAIQEALASEAEGNGIFSSARAQMIARTEVSTAQAGGNFWTWVQSGVVKKVKWLVSNLEPCPVCLGNENQEVTLGEFFRSGIDRPPQHPNCACVLVVTETT